MRTSLGRNLTYGMLDVIGHVAGARPGGMTVAIIIVGVLMGASTGIVAATVVTVGLISLPTLLARQYNKALACGTICAAGTLGQIIPPSLVLIVLADISGESVGTLFAGALIPGLLLSGLYVIYLVIMAKLKPHTMPPIDASERAAVDTRTGCGLTAVLWSVPFDPTCLACVRTGGAAAAAALVAPAILCRLLQQR